MPTFAASSTSTALVPDVVEVAAALAGNPVHDGRSSAWRLGLRRAWRTLHWQRPRGAEQVRFHCDVCDDFQALWLGPLRVYSCAWFDTPGCSLAQAQQAKPELVCRKLRLAPGQRFLDAGAGWCALLLWAAEHHVVQATGIALSRNQHEHLNRLIDAKGLRGRVRMLLLDYRELQGEESFDRIASMGMFEHLGRRRLDGDFDHLQSACCACCAPAAWCSTTASRPAHCRMPNSAPAWVTSSKGRSLRAVSWCTSRRWRVVWQGPGSSSSMPRTCARTAPALRPHYALTPWAWSAALEAQRERARALTSDATLRAYRLALAGSAMSFERGRLGLVQLLATRPDGRLDTGALRGAQSDYPFYRRSMLAAPSSRGLPAAAATLRQRMAP